MSKKKTRVPANTYEIHLTNKCNLACKYCFEKDKGKLAMDANDIKDIVQDPITTRLYLFGGEPMMHASFHNDLRNLIYESNAPLPLKEYLWDTASSTTTNGTDIIKFPETYKELGMRFQISVDGPKEVHDRNRIYRDGRGSFDRIMENIDELEKNNARFELHGVVSKNSIKDLYDILVFFFEEMEQRKGKKEAIQRLGKNTFMFVIEDDYNDDDIDLAIKEYDRFYDYLKERLSEEEYKEAVLSIATKKGSQCGAGSNTLMLHPDGTLYPCHRGNGGGNLGDREDYTLGDSFTDTPENTQIFNSYFRARALQESYTLLNNPVTWDVGSFTPQVYYCPATFKEVSDTVFYIPPQYSIFMYELGSYVVSKALEEGWGIEDIIRYSATGCVAKEEDNGISARLD